MTFFSFWAEFVAALPFRVWLMWAFVAVGLVGFVRGASRFSVFR